MNNVFYRLIVLFSPLLFSFTTEAQLPGFKIFKLEKDNKKVKINTLFKDNRGYIYAGTDNGVYKFDGEKYIHVDFEDKNHNDTATAIFQDRQGKMWIGFKNGNIANLVNKKLYYFNPEEGTPKKSITAFLQDKENNLWFSTNGEGIYFFRNSRLFLINEEDGLSDVHVSSLILTGNGDVLAGTDEGLNICSLKNGKKNITVLGPRQGLPDYIVSTLAIAGDDSYWIGLQDKGFCLYNHTEKKIIIPPGLKEWNYGTINSIYQSQNTLWLATYYKGLFKYSLTTNRLDTLSRSLIGNNINSLLQDNQGNTWLSSADSGMVRTPSAMLKLVQVPGAPVFEHIHAILCDRAGSVWLNDEWNNLIKVYFEKDVAVAKKIRLPGLNEKTDITSLYQDCYGNIWVGAIGKGLFILDPINFHHRAFTENKLFINAGILSINGTQNTIFVSSLEGSMLLGLSYQNKSIDNPYRYTNYDNKSIGTNYIYSIFKDSKGRTWFATDGKGLTMLSGNKFTYYNNKEQIKDDRIYSITEDDNGNIWFSTAAEGIYKFDGKNFINYSLNEGLSDLNVSVLKKDRSGNIIIVHKKGLDILDPVTGNISCLGSSQGIPVVNAEDIGAVTKDTSGNVMVSTTNGILTYIFPEKARLKPTALIESVQLFLKDLDENASNIFAYDENNFTFNYTGLYYNDPENVFYEYKLEGLDSIWVTTRDRSKNFPKLAPGKYTFRIRASMNKNFKNADEASYSFVIKKPFYKTTWFIISSILLLGFLVYWYIKNREKALKRIERLRQEKIQFEFEMLRNQVNPHFLFNSFNTLISAIEEEPGIAVEYAEQLSDFFRNIVNQRDKDIISLKDEIDSLYSYSFLQQKRYGDNLVVNIDLSDEEKKQHMIPPLTLQLLMENGIKHNAVSKETPLTILISINKENYLEVSNNMNSRKNKQAGTGMGLQNIISRYHLLTHKKVLIKNDGKNFIVSLPLLK